jgi:CRP-like cAMP-binding protein
MIETSMFRNVYLFSQLSDATLAQIAAVLETRQFDPGEVLFHQGDPGDDLFIVREGSVGIFEPSPDKPGEETPIRIFQAGEVFGEMALIDRQPRTLSARALAPTETWLLHRDAFQWLLRDHDMALAVMASLNDRIRYTTEFLSEVQGWVGRVAKGEYEFVDDVRGWVRQVAEGAYDEPFEAHTQGRDPTIAALAADFARMAARVKQREDALRKEIAQLRIEIDETKRERQVAEITESDYFRDIQAQAKRLRQKRG